MKSNLSIIVAVAENGVIGKDNQMAWNIRDDMAWFKRHTMNRTIIAGRKTHESILTRSKGKLLPGRKTVVLTRDPAYKAEGCIVLPNWEETLRFTKTSGEAEIFIIGGQEIYKLALPFAEKLYLTKVHASPNGDAFFPEFNPAEWLRTESDFHKADERNEYPFTFQIWQRKPD